MNTQSKRANFSPYQEESNAEENSQNHCSEHAYDWGSGQHRRGPQQIKAAIERSGVLRRPAANMPGQSRLSASPTKVTHSKRVL